VVHRSLGPTAKILKLLEIRRRARASDEDLSMEATSAAFLEPTKTSSLHRRDAVIVRLEAPRNFVLPYIFALPQSFPVLVEYV
jgi:hypothetical protein